MATDARTQPVRFPADDVEIGGEIAEARAEPRGELVLFPDVHGLSDLYRRLATRFADEGYTTLVLDPYVRQGTPHLPDPTAVARWIAELDDRRAVGDVEAALRFLRGRPGREARRVGVVGFCLGGQYALMAACLLRGLDACVSFYGMLRAEPRPPRKPWCPLELVPELRCPLLALFGADDPLIPLADVRELERALGRAGKDFEVEVYPGAGHAFLNDTRPDAYRPEAAERAWRRAIGFLRARLG